MGSTAIQVPSRTLVVTAADMRKSHPWFDKTAIGSKVEPVGIGNPAKRHDHVLTDP
jgi:hypothetical protein